MLDVRAGELSVEETPNIEQGIMNIEEDDDVRAGEWLMDTGCWMLDARAGECVIDGQIASPGERARNDQQLPGRH